MKYSIFAVLILFGFFIFACNEKKDEKVESVKQSKSMEDTSKQVQKKDNTNTERKTYRTLTNITYDVKDIPAGIQYEGKIVASARWSDNNGDNLVLVTETDVKETTMGKKYDNEPVSEKKLFGYHYILEKNKLLWKIQDFINECLFDLDLSYIPNSLTITDLNYNGIGESTFMYKLACRSDVSPADLKLLMHENDKKYAIRGETVMVNPDGSKYGGEMKVDPALNSVQDFVFFAKTLWNKFNEEKFD